MTQEIKLNLLYRKRLQGFQEQPWLHLNAPEPEVTHYNISFSSSSFYSLAGSSSVGGTEQDQDEAILADM